jgi:hypothetical protein
MKKAAKENPVNPDTGKRKPGRPPKASPWLETPTMNPLKPDDFKRLVSLERALKEVNAWSKWKLEGEQGPCPTNAIYAFVADSLWTAGYLKGIKSQVVHAP